jgi:hypothetical protein
VDYLNIKVRCQLTDSSLLSLFKRSRRVKAHTIIIELVKKDISSMFHANEPWIRLLLAHCQPEKCLKNPTLAGSKQAVTSSMASLDEILSLYPS